MKVVCVSTLFTKMDRMPHLNGTNWTGKGLIIGNIYEMTLIYETVCEVIDEYNRLGTYDKNWFITLAEWRDKQIEEIL